MNRLIVSAAHKSSGKTLLTLGLCAALRDRGLRVQAFKKGPDYIDPMWLAQASARPCYNLDPHLMSAQAIGQLFARHGGDADLCLVEGNKGLYDGLALDGSNSNAALAKLLGLPVVLVLDARGMTRGIAPLILGYQAFDRQLNIAGVILNRVGGARHEAKLRAVIEHYTDVAVLGAVGEDAALSITERHLGLIPSHELGQAEQRVNAIGQRIAAQLDLSRLLALAATAAPLPALAQASTLAAARTSAGQATLRIGVARDAAFGFYYPDDLQALQDAGAQLLFVDTLRDAKLPALDGLFIGGGFPELFMRELEANAALRRQIAAAIKAGLPVYAECGGLMYLSRSLSWRGQTCAMVGAIAGDACMHDRPVGRGYVQLEATADAPWPGLAGQTLRAHEFHYSSLDNLAADQRFAFRVTRGHGVNGHADGIVQHNVLATYGHLRSITGNDWARHFVDFVRRCAKRHASTLDEVVATAS